MSDCDWFSWSWSGVSAGVVVGEVIEVVGKVAAVVREIAEVVGELADVVGEIAEVVGRLAEVVGRLAEVVGELARVPDAGVVSMTSARRHHPGWSLTGGSGVKW